MYGKCKAFVRGSEEQGRGSLHGHCLVWLDDFYNLKDSLFDNDPVRRENARKELERFVDRHFCSDYGYSPELEVIHKECQQQGCISDMFQEKDAQTLRDCRSESHWMEVKGQVMECKYCIENGFSGETSQV